MPHQPEGYAVIVQPSGDRWIWAITDLDANVAASGEAGDRASAWRCGSVAAATLGALARVGRRRF
ncbi:MAG: hypothetical protein KA105_05680 [Caulobacter sp.]|jgi:hypothetical protein|nr:hypothetical protein [Caulobacter sp.]